MNVHAEFERMVQIGISLADVEPEQVEWLWPCRVPLGKITVLDGDPDNGKSVLTTDLCARVSVGRALPDGTLTKAAGAVILSAEDGAADTIRPRFDAAGGDPAKVRLLGLIPEDEEYERVLSIPEDVPILEQCIRQVGASLVVIDPIMAFLSSEVNANRDQDVRRALTPLAKMAERTGAAVVIIRHLNKAVGMSALYRGGGSIGIIGAARSGLMVGRHPEDESLRVLAGQKNNLSLPPESLVYGIETAANGAARIGYKGTTDTNAQQLLKVPGDEEERSALSEAKEFLLGELEDGPMTARQVKKNARDADVSERTLKRAKQALGVKSEKENDGSWTWSLPLKEAKGGQPSTVGPVGTLGPLEDDKSAYLSEEGQGGQGGQANGLRDGWPPSSNGRHPSKADDWRDHPLSCACEECL